MSEYITTNQLGLRLVWDADALHLVCPDHVIVKMPVMCDVFGTQIVAQPRSAARSRIMTRRFPGGHR